MSIAFGYFLAKIYLSYTGHIRLNIVLNLLFLALLYFTGIAPLKYPRLKSLRVPRILAAVIAGLWLIWKESWLPSPGATAQMLSAWGLPTWSFIGDFVLRFFRPRESLAVAAIFVAAFLARKYVKTMSVITALLLAACAWLPMASRTATDPAGLDGHLARFYEEESKKIMPFKPPESSAMPFDVIFLSICSVSWQDLMDAGFADHPLFSEFDYLFTAFNSVSSYSNPAVLRLLNANRGQVKHSELYENTFAGSSVFESLKNLGYAVYLVLNHNGVYGKFLEEIRNFGYVNGRVIRPENIPSRIKMFDGSPVYRDYDALKSAWQERQKSKDDRAALFYNSVSLHDGNYFPEDRDMWKRELVKSYQLVIKDLLDDTLKFIRLVESSGRRAVIIFIPEHGRSLRGSEMQVPGFRDIPLPALTSVPVGVKLAGGRAYPYKLQQLEMTEPASYFAISYMVSVFVEKNPFLKEGFNSIEFVHSIPGTAFVAENAENTVVKLQEDYFLRDKNQNWTRLSPEQLK